jgi:RNA polymerase sigma factor (TIGR02999 family)
MSDVTQILAQIEQGDARAADQLLPLVYDELRKLAAAKLACEKSGQTLQPTALVHEAYLRLVKGQDQSPWNGRGHFFAAAAQAMRRILVESARHKQRIKHGGQLKRVELEPIALPPTVDADELLALDAALEQLAATEPVIAELVQLRHFAGLTIQQTAEAMGISVRTANRHWAYAKAWLYQQLHREE